MAQPIDQHDADTTVGPATGEALDLRQLRAMTDGTGLFQHARLALPDPHHGYCVDDNARALVLAVRLQALDIGPGRAPIDALVNRYLTFVTFAIDPGTHRIRNFMSYDRRWLEPVGSNDSQGRALWALGVCAHRAPLGHQRALAVRAFQEALPGTARLDSLRAWAFILLGLDPILQTPDGGNDPQARERFGRLADRLAAGYRDNATADWPWWEPVVQYDNARLPQAMLAAGAHLGRDDYTAIGLESLGWLLDIQTHPEQGHLSVIGNDGWFRRPRKGEPTNPARFDQQPLEPAALIDACLAAYRATRDGRWVAHARRCLAWYHGENDLGAPLIDAETGGCRDGLTPAAVNLNQGAESILAYLMSRQTMRVLQAESTA